ncbi:murein biosynthesis integral membrane protein MurJ [Enterococcus sp. LJL128]
MKKTTFWLMIISILSKGIGFVREMVISYFYGASKVSDAYFISLTIPFTIFSFVYAGLTTSFIPSYTRLETEDMKKANRFTNSLITLLFIFCLIIAVIIQIFTYPIVKMFALGFSGETLDLAVLFTRVTIWSLFFSGCIELFNALLQIRKKFIFPAILGFIYNFFVILSVYLSFKWNLIWLSLGSVCAAVTQFLFLLIILKREKFSIVPNLSFRTKEMNDFFKKILPVIFGASVTQINILINKTIASQVSIGGVSSFNYADRINSFILSTVVFSLVAVIYPMLSKLYVEKKKKQFKQGVQSSLITMLVLLVPATIGLMLLSEPITVLLFGRGSFDSRAVELTSATLYYLSLGLLPMGLRELISRIYYSMEDMRTPVVNATIGMIVNIIFSLFLPSVMGIGGLGLASTIAAIITTYLLCYDLSKKKIIQISNLKSDILKISIAGILMGGITKYMNVTLSNFGNLSVLFTIIISVLGYFIFIYLFKVTGVSLLNLRRKKND